MTDLVCVSSQTPYNWRMPYALFACNITKTNLLFHVNPTNARRKTSYVAVNWISTFVYAKYMFSFKVSPYIIRM